jgi:hypothetical protein
VALRRCLLRGPFHHLFTNFLGARRDHFHKTRSGVLEEIAFVDIRVIIIIIKSGCHGDNVVG